MSLIEAARGHVDLLRLNTEDSGPSLQGGFFDGAEKGRADSVSSVFGVDPEIPEQGTASAFAEEIDQRIVRDDGCAADALVAAIGGEDRPPREVEPCGPFGGATARMLVVVLPIWARQGGRDGRSTASQCGECGRVERSRDREAN
jgi:hypothetical protein